MTDGMKPQGMKPDRYEHAICNDNFDELPTPNNPEKEKQMTHGMKQWLVPTSCLGCAVSITAFKRTRDGIWDDSIHISALSHHAHLYYNSWRGRLRFAWEALKGNYLDDIDLELPEDIEAFSNAMNEVYVWLKDRDNKKDVRDLLPPESLRSETESEM